MAKEGTYKCKPPKSYKQVSIATLVERFEKTYGDIRDHRDTWISAYNTYKLQQNNGWPKWDWDVYEYWTYIPNHTRIEFDSFIQDRELHRNITKEIHTKCTEVMAYNRIVYDAKY